MFSSAECLLAFSRVLLGFHLPGYLQGPEAIITALAGAREALPKMLQQHGAPAALVCAVAHHLVERYRGLFW